MYDYFLTLPQEIKCIWKRKPSTATALFLVNRYIVMCNRGFRMIQAVSWQGQFEHTADRVSDSILGSHSSCRDTIGSRCKFGILWESSPRTNDIICSTAAMSFGDSVKLVQSLCIWSLQVSHGHFPVDLATTYRSIFEIVFS